MKRVILLFFTVLSYSFSFGQCPAAGFTTQGPTCAGAIVNITNSSAGSSTYQWDFCPYQNFDSTAIQDFGNLGNLLFDVFSLRLVRDSANYYGFCVNSGSVLIRMDFGNDMDNAPTATSLGNIGTGDMRAPITFVRTNNNWYGFACAYSGDLFRLDFGNSLTNNPTVTYVNVILNSSIYSMDMATDSGEFILLAGSYNFKNITVVNFGNNILNLTPTANALPSSLFPGPGGILDIDIVHECNSWFAVVLNYFGNIYKLDFGTSLNNIAPVSTTLFGLSSANLRGSMFRINNKWNYFFYTRALGVKIIDFGVSMTNNTPVFQPSLPLDPGAFGTIEGNDFIYCNGEVFGIATPYTTPSLQRFKYHSICGASITESSDFEPSVLSYSQGGTYGIQLIAYDSLGNSAFFYDSVTVSAAPEATFSFSDICLGQTTDFDDQSTITGGSIIGWKWFFGDGDSAVVQDPQHAYASTGDYDVQLISFAASGCSDTAHATIHIASMPDADFLSVTGCSDNVLQFNDSSQIAAGTIVGWQWNFGDGTGTSLNEDPVYTYADGGTYTVSLTVNSDSGCSNTQQKQIIIHSSPDGNFIVTNTCVGQPVQFINQTVSDTAVQSYLWDFGDTITDTTQNPSHSYAPVVASYLVMMVANAANGCSDTVIQTVKINNIPSASFSYTPVNACEGNAVSFTDLSVVSGDSISKWLWTFGDGYFDTVPDPFHVFENYGNYTVSLIAYAATSCGSSTSQIISVIESPTAQFSYTPVCLGSTTVFTDSTMIPSGSTITRYHWDFGDSDTSDLQNPVHDFVTSGSHAVVLTVETNFGCTDQDTVLVTVHPPPNASFNFTNPCSDYPVTFNSTSAIQVPYTINSYTWNFGDPASGTNDTSSFANPSHTFDTTQSYAVTLIVSSNAGCLDTAFSVLSIKQSSIVNFQYSPTCLGDYTDFSNLCTPPSLDTAWFWRFGDGQFSILEEPAHYYVNAGPYLVTLTVTASNGCVSEASKTVSVSPIPVADFVKTPICIGTPYQFQDNSSIASGSSLVRWKWVIAGFDSSSLQNPTFTFPDTGNYSVTLTVTSSDSCDKSVTKQVTVYPLPVANFQFNPQYGNPPLEVFFTNLTSGGLANNWQFGDGNQSTAVNPSNTYQDTGKYTIQLISVSSSGCIDTIQKTIYVIKPRLDIAVESCSSYVLNNHLYLSAVVKNFGTRDVSTFHISADIENGNPIQETFTGLLPNGPAGTMLYPFNASFELTDGQSVNYFCIRVSKPNGENDDVPANDEKCTALASNFSVKNPYPNPFTSSLTLEVILPYSDQLSVELFDMAGKKVRELYNGNATKGLNTFQLDLQQLASGVYTLKCLFRDELIIRPVMKSNLPK